MDFVVGGGGDRSTDLFRDGTLNRSSRLRAGVDSGAGCALLWGVTIRAPVRRFAGEGWVDVETKEGTVLGGCGAN